MGKVHAGTLLLNFKDIKSFDIVEGFLFSDVLIKTDSNDFGRTLQFSIIKKEDVNMLSDAFEDYKKNNNINIEKEDVEKENNKSVGVDDLLKYAELYERVY